MTERTEWKFFLVQANKSPFPNCSHCRDAGPDHDRETCECLTCHGFYAATADPNRLAAMSEAHPTGVWAVRCGAASGIIVLDAEGTPDGNLPSGVEVMDDWETWTGGLKLPPTPLVALTPSGGVHRFYRWVEGVRSRNRILPGVDVKSDGGYVLVPHRNAVGARRWVSRGEPADLDPGNLAWLQRAAAGRRGWSTDDSAGWSTDGERPVGYDYEAFLRDGCPGGQRDEFFNELAFRLRKRGIDRALATSQIREAWKNCQQPPLARWYMPWHHIEYKIERIWRTIEPDEVSEWQRDAVSALTNADRVRVNGGRGTVIMRFTGWLTTQCERDDPVGDIAREVSYDDCLAVINATPAELRRHLIDEHRATDEAVIALDLAASEWRGDV